MKQAASLAPCHSPSTSSIPTTSISPARLTSACFPSYDHDARGAPQQAHLRRSPFQYILCESEVAEEPSTSTPVHPISQFLALGHATGQLHCFPAFPLTSNPTRRYSYKRLDRLRRMHRLPVHLTRPLPAHCLCSRYLLFLITVLNTPPIKSGHPNPLSFDPRLDCAVLARGCA
ncbi:hypothetical protein R3P38DRAFT_3292016, partial [Favolaschia claudopus]